MTRSFDVFFDLRLNKRLSKHSKCLWFEVPSCSLWCRCNEWCHMVSEAFAIIGSGNGLVHDARKAIIWRNACLVSVGPSGQLSLEFDWKCNHFHPTKCIRKCCQHHDGHFVQAGLNVSTLCVGIYFSKQKYISSFLSFLDTGMLNSLRLSEAYMGRKTNHHWFR